MSTYTMTVPAGQDVAYPLPDYEVYPMPPGNNQVYPPAYGYPLQYGMSNGSQQQLYYAQGQQPYSMDTPHRLANMFQLSAYD